MEAKCYLWDGPNHLVQSALMLGGKLHSIFQLQRQNTLKDKQEVTISLKTMLLVYKNQDWWMQRWLAQFLPGWCTVLIPLKPPNRWQQPGAALWDSPETQSQIKDQDVALTVYCLQPLFWNTNKHKKHLWHLCQQDFDPSSQQTGVEVLRFTKTWHGQSMDD